MNKRILELAKQAGLKSLSETAISPQEQKFAELIVRECAKESFEFWCNQVDCSEESAESHILKHFGVGVK
jgi:hypothetical protein